MTSLIEICYIISCASTGVNRKTHGQTLADSSKHPGCLVHGCLTWRHCHWNSHKQTYTQDHTCKHFLLTQSQHLPPCCTDASQIIVPTSRCSMVQVPLLETPNQAKPEMAMDTKNVIGTHTYTVKISHLSRWFRALLQ